MAINKKIKASALGFIIITIPTLIAVFVFFNSACGSKTSVEALVVVFIILIILTAVINPRLGKNRLPLPYLFLGMIIASVIVFLPSLSLAVCYLI